LGPGGVVVSATVEGHSYQATVASMSGRFIVGDLRYFCDPVSHRAERHNDVPSR
jgi:hypothetical protein